jgi:hypothetical protein
MMQQLGPAAEVNPLVRMLFRAVGPAGVALLKIGVGAVVIPVFLYLARRGRPVLARNCLAIATCAGLIGTLSNLG